MRSFGMAASAAGLGFLAFALAACTHVPLLIAGMDAEDIQRVSNDDLCRSSDTFLQTRGRRFANIETEIDRRGLPCGDNETQVAEARPAAALATATVPAGGTETVSRALQSANMRGGPGTGHAVVGSLRAGETVTVLRVVDGWCECRNSARRIVFIRCNLLAPPPGGWAAVGGTTATGIPTFSEGALYSQIRRQLLSEGWQPARPTGSDVPRCVGESSCANTPEIITCYGASYNACGYAWRRGETYLLVVGVGEGEDQYIEDVLRCSRITYLRMTQPRDWCSRPDRAPQAPSSDPRIGQPSALRVGAITLDIIPRAPTNDCYWSLDPAGRQIVGYSWQNGTRYNINGRIYTFYQRDSAYNRSTGAYTSQTRDNSIFVRIAERLTTAVNGDNNEYTIVNLEVGIHGSRNMFRAYHFCPPGD